MDKDNNYVVIMAGGIGSRLWPISTQEYPKQFIDILNVGETLLQSTYKKYINFCSANNIYIVTNKDYLHFIKEQLPSFPDTNILCEPINRNTAICIAYAAYKIALINSKANIIITPSDQLLTDNEQFISTITDALKASQENNYIVTIGIKPHNPYTQYGYIQCDTENLISNNLYKVKTFTEKPSEKLAKQFLLSEEFLWNTGIFVCKANNLINAFGKYLSTISHIFWGATSFLNTPSETEKIKEVYLRCPNISIDYGLMEKADNIYTIIAKFGWIDLGSWPALYNSIQSKDSNKNVTINSGSIQLTNVNNCLIYNTQKEKQINISNKNNCIIINTDKELLITDNCYNK